VLKGKRYSAMTQPKTIHDWIASRANRLTANELRLSAHMGEHLDLWAYESAAQLAARLGVHRSSIVRLAQKLGLSGFPELQEAARNALLKSFSPSPDLSLKCSVNTHSEVVEGIYQRELMNLRQTYESLDIAELDATAKSIAQSERVVLFGRRFSYPIALYLSLALKTMRDSVRLTPDPGGSAVDSLFDLTPEDFVLVVSMRRHSPEVQRSIDFLSKLRVPQALLTDVSIKVNLKQGMRILYAYVGSNSLLDSYTALTSVSHTLLSLTSNYIEGSRGRLESAESAWNKFNRLEL
jgi:DNA-binding MurR/RpiR family transcriptional regulator